MRIIWKYARVGNRRSVIVRVFSDLDPQSLVAMMVPRDGHPVDLRLEFRARVPAKKNLAGRLGQTRLSRILQKKNRLQERGLVAGQTLQALQNFDGAFRRAVGLRIFSGRRNKSRARVP